MYMWTYEYINKNYLSDCVMQNIIIYQDDILRAQEFVKMPIDDPQLWEDFANNYIQFLDSIY